MNILVLDVGTSSMRGILFDHCGKLLVQKQILYHAIYMEDSMVEQNPKDWKNALYEILKYIAKQTKELCIKIEAISITSQRSSVIPMDENLTPLCNAIMWQDKRTNHICELRENLNDEIFNLCGSRINPVFSASKMTWIREERPDIYKKTYKFMVIPDYLIYLMTGKIYTDYTYGSRSLLMNIHTHEWDDRLLEIFEVEKEKLCPLIEPGSICGTTTENLAKLTGIEEGIPVITAGGDQQCGAIGQGVVKQGVLSITTGTGGYLIAETDHVPENLKQDVVCNFSSINGQYILESSVLTCSSAFDWFRKEFFSDISYDELNKQIEETPIGANGCICVPYFLGRSTPDWNNMAKGVFANITLSTTKQDMLRSLLEGICFEIRNGIDVIDQYMKIDSIYINGGLSNSMVFNEMQANIYDMEIIKKGHSDATARGALMVGTKSMGVYPTVEAAFKAIDTQEKLQIYYPEKEKAFEYEKSRLQMNQIYSKICENKIFK